MNFGFTQNNTKQNTKIHEHILYKDLSYKLQGIFFDLRKTYGPGHKESVYSNLLAELLKLNRISFQKEKRIYIYSIYGQKAGIYTPDFLIEDKILLELKSSRFTNIYDEKQAYSYVRNSKYELIYLVNFSTPKLFIKRIIYTNDLKPFLSKINNQTKDMSQQ